MHMCTEAEEMKDLRASEMRVEKSVQQCISKANRAADEQGVDAKIKAVEARINHTLGRLEREG
ncbi:unnamed protein product, partial [Chrysoparadoxa australica]